MTPRIIFPGTLATALASTRIQPGDTLFLRAGTYTGDFTCGLVGSAAYPITISPYPGEYVIIDGSLSLVGSNYVTVDGVNLNLEVKRSSFTDRNNPDPGSDTNPPWCYVGINSGNQNNIIKNCIVHDCPGGIYNHHGLGWQMFGNLVYYIGWQSTDRGHGHCCYVYGAGSVEQKNMLMGGFGWNIHNYRSEVEEGVLDNFLMEDNISFRGGQLDSLYYEHPDLLMGGVIVAHSPVLNRNYTYDGQAVEFGTPAEPATDVTLLNNYFPEGYSLVSGSNLLSNSGGTYTHEAVNKIFVIPVTTIRANVAVYNWELADSIIVDLSAVSGLAVGNTVSVHNVQDYFTDIQSLVLNSSKQITVDMRAISHTVATPIGWATTPDTTFPEFGAFIVIKA